MIQCFCAVVLKKKALVGSVFEASKSVPGCSSFVVLSCDVGEGGSSCDACVRCVFFSSSLNDIWLQVPRTHSSAAELDVIDP